MPDLIRLPDVRRRLRIDYQQLYRAAMSGIFPVERLGRGRGYLAARKENLSQIARHFGARFDAGQVTA